MEAAEAETAEETLANSAVFKGGEVMPQCCERVHVAKHNPTILVKIEFSRSVGRM